MAQLLGGGCQKIILIIRRGENLPPLAMGPPVDPFKKYRNPTSGGLSGTV